MLPFCKANNAALYCNNTHSLINLLYLALVLLLTVYVGKAVSTFPNSQIFLQEILYRDFELMLFLAFNLSIDLEPFLSR